LPFGKQVDKQNEANYKNSNAERNKYRYNTPPEA